MILFLYILLLSTVKCHRVQSITSDHDIVSAGRFHTCGIHKRNGIELGGTVKCWGYNDYGQASPPYGMFTQVSSGHFHSCAISIDGRVECWGAITGGPQSQHKHETYYQICSGERHSCAIKRHDGYVECWGSNDFGESEPPLSVYFTQISCGNGHTCGIKDNGEVYCWGRNKFGESSPPPKTRFKQISIGHAHHACGITKDDDIKCWGDNRRSQSKDLKGPFKQVSSGTRSTCAIHEKSGLQCWGASPPIDPSELDTFQDSRQVNGDIYRQISSGSDHICAILQPGGELHCWSSGFNFNAHDVPLGFKAAL